MLLDDVHRRPPLPYRRIALAGRKVVARVLEQPYCVLDALSELVDALGLVAVVAHRPTQRLDPVFHDVGRPVYAVESGAVAEHGDDVGGVALLVSDEFESDAPEHGDADQDEAVR